MISLSRMSRLATLEFLGFLVKETCYDLSSLNTGLSIFLSSYSHSCMCALKSNLGSFRFFCFVFEGYSKELELTTLARSSLVDVAFCFYF